MIYAITLYIEAEDVADVIHFLNTIETGSLVDFEVSRADVYENEKLGEGDETLRDKDNNNNGITLKRKSENEKI